MAASFSAAEQGLGYIYQSRFALLKLLDLPESSSVLIEKDDDLDFIDEKGRKSLASLKHKAMGDSLTDLSTDFWKSVRVWLSSYKRDNGSASALRFFLFTTGKVSEASFLRHLLQDAPKSEVSLSILAKAALEKSDSKIILKVKADYDGLSEDQVEDFLSRVIIFDNSPRITDVPSIVVDQHLPSVWRDYCVHLFERLEGWWNDLIINY